MEIQLSGPFFKCAEDESVFFSRIYALPGFERIAGNGRNLCLILQNEPDRQAINQIREICETWNIEFKVLD